jgi:hypothetical protein
VAERAVYDFSKALRESKNVSDTCHAHVLSRRSARHG